MSEIFSNFEPGAMPENPKPEKPARKKREPKAKPPVEATTAPPRKPRKIKKSKRKKQVLAAPAQSVKKSDWLDALLEYIPVISGLNPKAVNFIHSTVRHARKFDRATQDRIFAGIAFLSKQ